MNNEKNRQITEFPLYLHEHRDGTSEIIGRKGKQVRRVETGGGMPEGGEPYKQLVTDGSGNAVWEDRLAYKDENALIEDFNLENAYFSTGSGGITECYIPRETLPVRLVEGVVYTVNWNGTAYVCTCKDFGGQLFIGNGATGGLEDTGEPFTILDLADIHRLVIMDINGATSNSVALSHIGTAYVKVREEFLPEECTPYVCNTHYSDLTDEECINIYIAFMANRRVMMTAPSGTAKAQVLSCFYSSTVGFWAYMMNADYAYYVYGSENSGFEYKTIQWFDLINAT